MTRLQKFLSLKTHAWYGKFYIKLTNDEIASIMCFIENRKDASRDSFCYDVNRWGITFDSDVKKFKNYSLMVELTSVSANTEGKT